FEKREGYAQRDGLIRITSKEGVPVTVQYRLRFGVAGDHIPDAQLIVNDGWNAWIRARVSEAVSAVAAQVPIEELVSPTSRFNTQRDPLRRTVAAHLGQSGLKVTAFEIARLDVDRDALLRVKRAELRRDVRPRRARGELVDRLAAVAARQRRLRRTRCASGERRLSAAGRAARGVARRTGRHRRLRADPPLPEHQPRRIRQSGQQRRGG